MNEGEAPRAATATFGYLFFIWNLVFILRPIFGTRGGAIPPGAVKTLMCMYQVM